MRFQNDEAASGVRSGIGTTVRQQPHLLHGSLFSCKHWTMSFGLHKSTTCMETREAFTMRNRKIFLECKNVDPTHITALQIQRSSVHQKICEKLTQQRQCLAHIAIPRHVSGVGTFLPCGSLAFLKHWYRPEPDFSYPVSQSMVHDVLPVIVFSTKVPRLAVWVLQSVMSKLAVVIAEISNVHDCSEIVGNQRWIFNHNDWHWNYFLVRVYRPHLCKMLGQV